MHDLSLELAGPTDPEAGALPPTEPTARAGRRRDLLAMQRAVVAMGRRAMAPPDVSVLMQDAAALLAEMLDSQCSGMAELSPDGKRLFQRLALHEAKAAVPQIVARELGASGGDSLAGYVLEVAHPAVVADLKREKRFADLLLRKHGIQSAVAAPLKLHDRSFGSLAAYSRQVGYFDDDDLPFVETVAHLVAATIARSEAEKSLVEERRLSGDVLQTVNALVLTLDSRWQILRSNPACQRVTGFSPAELEARSLWSVFGAAAESEAPQRILAELQAGTSPVDCQSDLLTKHSRRRRIAWSFSATFDGAGAIERIIATGIDITAQREAEERAWRAERSGEEARQAAARLAAAGGRAELSDAAAGDRSQPAGAGPQIGTFGLLPMPLHAERRKRPRRCYPYTQIIAPIVDGKLPRRDQFFEVKCHDIAAGGFSFLSLQPPSYDCLVVALGVPPKVTYLTAQVAHVTRIEHEGQRMFLTGCNYTGRAAY